MIIVYLCLQIKSVKPLFLFLMVESGSCVTTTWIRPQSVPTDQSDTILETPHSHVYFWAIREQKVNLSIEYILI